MKNAVNLIFDIRLQGLLVTSKLDSEGPSNIEYGIAIYSILDGRSHP